jgi:hypothetical protein
MIQNHEDDFKDLIEKSNNLIEAAKDRKVFEEIHYDKIKHSSAIGIIFLIVMVFVGVSVYVVFTKIQPISRILSYILHSENSPNNSGRDI